MMSKQTVLFAPHACNLAETSRMVEVAKAITRDVSSDRTFGIDFISNGGDFAMIERHGFHLTRLKPRLTKEKLNAGGDDS